MGFTAQELQAARASVLSALGDKGSFPVSCWECLGTEQASRALVGTTPRRRSSWHCRWGAAAGFLPSSESTVVQTDLPVRSKIF